MTGGPATGGEELREFLAGMGNAPYDVLPLHTYGLPVLQPARERAQVARSMNDSARMYDRMYWHVLRQNGDVGYDLIRTDGSLRPAAQWLRARNR